MNDWTFEECQKQTEGKQWHTVVTGESKARKVVVTRKTSVEDHVAPLWRACGAKQKAPKVEQLPSHLSLARMWTMKLAA